jgi:hypothetical protein
MRAAIRHVGVAATRVARQRGPHDACALALREVVRDLQRTAGRSVP